MPLSLYLAYAYRIRLFFSHVWGNRGLCWKKKIRTYLVECFGMEELSMAGFFRLSLVHFHILGHVTEFSVGVLEDLPHPLGEDSRTPGM